VERLEQGQVSYAHEAYPEIPIEKVFRQLYEKKGVEASETLAVYTGQFFRVLSTQYIWLYKGAPELLQAIRAKGKKVYLLSNAQRIFTEYELRYLKLLPYFDGVLISSDYGCKKPDANFFLQLQEQFSVDLSRALMIGNDAVTDIAGARQMGMDTFYICSNISPRGQEMPEATYRLKHMDLYRVGAMLGFSLKEGGTL
jgi:putative hydrolase of the HAD superfamily